ETPAEHRVRHDVRVLFRREWSRLVQHRLTDADLPAVMHMAAKLDLTNHFGVESERSCDGDRVLTHPNRMTGRIRILHLERLAERLTARPVHLLESSRLGRDPFLEVLAVGAILEEESSLVERPRHARGQRTARAL